MGDRDSAMRVQTRFNTADALMTVVGNALTGGSLRVPVHITVDKPFEVVLETNAGLEAVRGSAEVIGHAGDATWIRFLSAVGTPAEDETRVVLDDVEVTLQGALLGSTGQELTEPPDAFEGDTAVNSRPEALDGLPSGSAEPVAVTEAAMVVEAVAAAAATAVPETAAPDEPIGVTVDKPGEWVATAAMDDSRSGPSASAVSNGNAATNDVPTSLSQSGRTMALPLAPPPEPLPLVPPPEPLPEPPVVSADVQDLPVPASLVGTSHTSVETTAATTVTAGASANEGTELTDVNAAPEPIVDRPTEQVSEAQIEASAVVARHEIAGSPNSVDVNANTEAIATTRLPALECDDTASTAADDSANATAATSSADAETTSTDATAATSGATREDRDDLVRDKIAVERGLPKVAEPYASESRSSRKWLYASVGISAACMLITASVVIWARGEVARARTVASEPPDQVAMAGEIAARGRSLDTRAHGKAVDTPQTFGAAAHSRAAAVATPNAAPVEPAAAEGTTDAATSRAGCSIRVSTNVAEARVWVDGKQRGVAPTTLAVGCDEPALVEVRHPRYDDFKRELTVTDGTLEVDARLEREKTRLTVWSQPAGAKVTYNGRVLGKTPLVTTVNRYEQGTLWFRAPGMAADWRKILPKESKKTVTITLKPKS